MKLRCESLCICHDGRGRLSCGVDETCVCSACEVERNDDAEISRIEQINQSLQPPESSGAGSAAGAPSSLDADVVIMQGEAAETTLPPSKGNMDAYAEAVSRMEQNMVEGTLAFAASAVDKSHIGDDVQLQ